MNFDFFHRIVGERFLGIYSLVATLMLAESGCTNPLGGPSGPVIHGRVTHGGVPVRSGQVVFSHPNPASMEVWGIGQIGPDGSYVVDTDAGGHPLPSGWYRIAVWRNGFNGLAQPSTEDGSSAKRQESEPEPTAPSPPPDPADKSKAKLEIPPRYSSHETSDLKLWVRPQAITVDIDLRD